MEDYYTQSVYEALIRERSNEQLILEGLYD